jgi:hypothetical protein
MIALRRFGGLYDEFATMTAAMVTQFSILIGYSVPDYGSDKTLFIYIVGYVFICTLALLNFLLAIVVRPNPSPSHVTHFTMIRSLDRICS